MFDILLPCTQKRAESSVLHSRLVQARIDRSRPDGGSYGGGCPDGSIGKEIRMLFNAPRGFRRWEFPSLGHCFRDERVYP